MIGEDCDDQEFEKIYTQLQNASCEDDVSKILVEVIGKKKTKEKGPLIVEMLGKKIKLEPVEQMCSDVRERGLNGKDIQRLKKLFESGQKFAFETFLK